MKDLIVLNRNPGDFSIGLARFKNRKEGQWLVSLLENETILGTNVAKQLLVSDEGWLHSVAVDRKHPALRGWQYYYQGGASLEISRYFETIASFGLGVHVWMVSRKALKRRVNVDYGRELCTYKSDPSQYEDVGAFLVSVRNYLKAHPLDKWFVYYEFW